MNYIDDFLDKRKEEGNLRILKPITSRKGVIITADGKEYVDFSSNDYLGLSQHPEMIKAAKEASEKYGTGSSASRLLSGDLEIFHELEEKTARFKGKEAALVFNTGYQANIGIISALYGKNDAIFSDKLCHASIIDGILLSGASHFRFKHNDIEHLERLLQSKRGNCAGALIITESVFSMDGDKAPLKEISGLSEKYNCRFMADEAHATGIFGKNGSGLVEEEGSPERIDLIMGTFSKALGSYGAYLACSDKIKQYLINACRSFIYSTALPPSVIAANIRAIDLVKDEPFRRKELLENSRYFNKLLKDKGIVSVSGSQIVPVVTGDNERSVELSDRLKEKGFRALPIRYPTVPKGEARVRFCLNYGHTKKMIDEAVEALK